MAIIDNPGAGGGGGGSVDETSALKYMLEHKTNYTGIAAGLTTLTELPAFTQPSGISVFSSMFDGCTALTTVPTLTYPSTGSTEFRNMFRNCKNLVSIPAVDIGISSDTTSMFEGCTAMSGSFTTTRSSGTGSGDRMFYNCVGLTSISITAQSNGTGFNSCQAMFYGCAKVTNIEFPIYSSSTSITNMASMCDGCGVLNTATLRINPGVSTALFISKAGDMFRSCYNLTTVSVIKNSNSTVLAVDLSYCNSVSRMFYGCKKLASIPDIQNTKMVTNFNSMFYNCNVLTSVPQLDMSGASSSNSLQNFVSGCTSLTNTSLNNILASLATWSGSANKTLKYIGLTSAQATTCTGLSNWSALSSAGWTTGY